MADFSVDSPLNSVQRDAAGITRELREQVSLTNQLLRNEANLGRSVSSRGSGGLGGGGSGGGGLGGGPMREPLAAPKRDRESKDNFKRNFDDEVRNFNRRTAANRAGLRDFRGTVRDFGDVANLARGQVTEGNLRGAMELGQAGAQRAGMGRVAAGFGAGLRALPAIGMGILATEALLQVGGKVIESGGRKGAWEAAERMSLSAHKAFGAQREGETKAMARKRAEATFEKIRDKVDVGQQKTDLSWEWSGGFRYETGFAKQMRMNAQLKKEFYDLTTQVFESDPFYASIAIQTETGRKTKGNKPPTVAEIQKLVDDMVEADNNPVDRMRRVRGKLENLKIITAPIEDPRHLIEERERTTWIHVMEKERNVRANDWNDY